MMFLTSYSDVLLAKVQGNVGSIGEMQKRGPSLKKVVQEQLTSIPYLSLHRLSIDVNRSCRKFYTNSRLRLKVEFITCEPRDYWRSAEHVKALVRNETVLHHIRLL